MKTIVKRYFSELYQVSLGQLASEGYLSPQLIEQLAVESSDNDTAVAATSMARPAMRVATGAACCAC